MKNFKDYLINEDYDFSGAPFSEKIYKTILKGFERYYVTNVGKYKSFKMDDLLKNIDIPKNRKFEYNVENMVDFFKLLFKIFQFS